MHNTNQPGKKRAPVSTPRSPIKARSRPVGGASGFFAPCYLRLTATISAEQLSIVLPYKIAPNAELWHLHCIDAMSWRNRC